jgi:hypothetical protein
MTAEKRPEKEPLLNTVARKLGHAAGTLTNVAQELSENISTLPETVSRKMRQVAMPGAARRSKKKTGRASGAKKARRAGARTGKSSQVSIKLARGRRKSASSKKKR